MPASLRAKALCSVIQCSAVLLGSLFGVCVIVTSCVCQLDFNIGYYTVCLKKPDRYD